MGEQLQLLLAIICKGEKFRTEFIMSIWPAMAFRSIQYCALVQALNHLTPLLAISKIRDRYYMLDCRSRIFVMVDASKGQGHCRRTRGQWIIQGNLMGIAAIQRRWVWCLHRNNCSSFKQAPLQCNIEHLPKRLPADVLDGSCKAIELAPSYP